MYDFHVYVALRTQTAARTFLSPFTMVTWRHTSPLFWDTPETIAMYVCINLILYWSSSIDQNPLDVKQADFTNNQNDKTNCKSDQGVVKGLGVLIAT